MKFSVLEFKFLDEKQILNVMVADTVLTRMRGLLARPQLQSREAMLIRSCNMIHTFGMRYPIDVAFLRKDGYVMKVANNVKPKRMRSFLGADCVLEMASGEINKCGIDVGIFLPIDSL